MSRVSPAETVAETKWNVAAIVKMDVARKLRRVAHGTTRRWNLIDKGLDSLEADLPPELDHIVRELREIYEGGPFSSFKQVEDGRRKLPDSRRYATLSPATCSRILSPKVGRTNGSGRTPLPAWPSVEAFLAAHGSYPDAYRTRWETARARWNTSDDSKASDHLIDEAAVLNKHQPVQSHGNRKIRKLIIPIILAVVAVAEILTAVTLTFKSDQEPSGSQGSTIPTGKLRTTDKFEGATIQLAFDKPGGCSRSYTVSGRPGRDRRLQGLALWVVEEMYADPARGDPNALYFAKAPITLRDGSFEVKIAANTAPGVRTARWALVAADSIANDDLQLSLDSDRAHDDRYPDGRRLRLPDGSREIASSSEFTQICPFG
jgi:hypothetical protein